MIFHRSLYTHDDLAAPMSPEDIGKPHPTSGPIGALPPVAGASSFSPQAVVNTPTPPEPPAAPQGRPPEPPAPETAPPPEQPQEAAPPPDQAPEPEQPPDPLAGLKGQILDIAKDTPSFGNKLLMRATGAHPDQLQSALDELTDQGALQRSKNRTNGRVYHIPKAPPENIEAIKQKWAVASPQEKIGMLTSILGEND